MNGRFTLYWRDGKRQVVNGKTIEEAFTAAGYGNGAVRAVDWYDNGISDTHHWDAEKHTWVKREPLMITEFPMSESLIDVMVHDLQDHRDIFYPVAGTGDKILISLRFGCFSITSPLSRELKTQWTEYIEVAYGEHEEFDDGESSYLISGLQYFPVTEIKEAVTAFINRVHYSLGGDTKRKDDDSHSIIDICLANPL